MFVADTPPIQIRSLMVRFWCDTEANAWRVLVKPVGSDEVSHFATVAAYITWVETTFGRNLIEKIEETP
jgi:hypothetical protein